MRSPHDLSYHEFYIFSTKEPKMYIFVKKRQECTHQICYNEKKRKRGIL